MGNTLPRDSKTLQFSSVTREIQFGRKDVLGQGKSVVFRGNYKGKEVAVKRIMLDLSSTPIEDCDVASKMKLHHNNVLKIFAVTQNEDFRFIVMELCTGTLAGVCNGTYNGTDLPSDRKVLYDIANGLCYIHKNKLIHRDITPDNILISSEGQIKLSDFGLSNELSTDQTYLLSGPFRGKRPWMAPELLNSASHSKIHEASFKSDIFSAGCVFFYFVTRGVHPYGNGEDSIVINIRRNNQINLKQLKMNHFASDGIHGMLQHDPGNRMSIEKILTILTKYNA